MKYSTLDDAALKDAVRALQAGTAAGRLTFRKAMDAVLWLRANGFDLVSASE